MRWEPGQNRGERKEIKDVKEADKSVYYKIYFLKSIYRERKLELEYAQKNSEAKL